MSIASNKVKADLSHPTFIAVANNHDINQEDDDEKGEESVTWEEAVDEEDNNYSYETTTTTDIYDYITNNPFAALTSTTTTNNNNNHSTHIGQTKTTRSTTTAAAVIPGSSSSSSSSSIQQRLQGLSVNINKLLLASAAPAPSEDYSQYTTTRTSYNGKQCQQQSRQNSNKKLFMSQGLFAPESSFSTCANNSSSNYRSNSNNNNCNNSNNSNNNNNNNNNNNASPDVEGEDDNDENISPVRLTRSHHEDKDGSIRNTSSNIGASGVKNNKLVYNINNNNSSNSNSNKSGVTVGKKRLSNGESKTTQRKMFGLTQWFSSGRSRWE
jgi:hypothetical protein